MNPISPKPNAFRGAEKRREPRLEKSIPLKLSSELGGDVVCQTTNISKSGAYCKVDGFIEPMTKLEVNLLIPFKRGDKPQMKKVSCSGVVVRTEPSKEVNKYNIAIFFNTIAPKDAKIISDYVSSLITEH